MIHSTKTSTWQSKIYKVNKVSQIVTIYEIKK